MQFAQLSEDQTLVCVNLDGDNVTTAHAAAFVNDQQSAAVTPALQAILANLGVRPGGQPADFLAAVARCGYTVVQTALDQRNGWVIRVAD